MISKCTKLFQNVPNGHKISKPSIKYSKWPQNESTSPHPRPSKIYPKWDFVLKIDHLATFMPIIACE
jgi:hypothetical protein